MADGRTSQDRYKARRKREIYALLGGCCKVCGFSDIRALQIDHVNSDGNITRQLGYSRRYRLVEADPSAFQLLCANCNWIKRHENFLERGGRPTHEGYVPLLVRRRYDSPKTVQ